MPLYTRDILGVWRQVSGNGFYVRLAGGWTNVVEAWVHTGGTWRRFFVRSDPQTASAQASAWSQVYRGTSGVTSTRSNNDKLAYWGHSFNDEIERSMIGFSAAQKGILDAAIAVRPKLSVATIHLWNGHVFSGTQTAYIGWHGSSSKPSTFQRLHTERNSSWYTAVALTKPPSGAGTFVSLNARSQTLATLEAQFRAGNIWGFTLSDEGSTGAPRWGWCGGTHYSTGNSGGIASGLTPVDSAHAWAVDLLLDFE